MVERICPQCQQGNPLDNRYCGHCGMSLERDELAPRQAFSLMAGGNTLPVQMKQVGTTLAVSLAALAAEAGLMWLRRRMDRLSVPVTPATRIIAGDAAQPVAQALTRVSQTGSNVTTIISQRVVEVWDREGLARKTVERAVWRREDS